MDFGTFLKQREQQKAQQSQVGTGFIATGASDLGPPMPGHVGAFNQSMRGMYNSQEYPPYNEANLYRPIDRAPGPARSMAGTFQMHGRDSYANNSRGKRSGGRGRSKDNTHGFPPPVHAIGPGMESCVGGVANTVPGPERYPYGSGDNDYQAYDDTYDTSNYDQYPREEYISTDVKDPIQDNQSHAQNSDIRKDETHPTTNQTSSSYQASKESNNKGDDDEDTNKATTHTRGAMGTLLNLQSENKDEGNSNDNGEHKASKVVDAMSALKEQYKDGEANEGSGEEDDDDDDGEDDDEKSEAIKKLPASHSRGLMSTLINMIGPEAVNRKPDPLPPPQPMKLKDEHAGYLKKKMASMSKKTEDNNEDEDEYYEDLMDVPADERDLNPDDFYDNGPGEDLYCKDCDVQTTSQKNFEDHLAGKAHRSRMASIASGKIMPGKMGKKRVHMALSDVGKRSLVLDVLERTNNKKEPILGLSFLTEFQSIYHVRCVCNLCAVKFDTNAALSHLTGAKHRFQYMKEKRPMEYVHLKRFGGKRTQLVSFLLELSMDVEKQDGSGKPVIKAFEKNSDDTKNQAEEPHKSIETIVETDNNDDLDFNKWVETELKKSRAIHEEKKSPSPPPGHPDDGPKPRRGYGNKQDYDFDHDFPPSGGRPSAFRFGGQPSDNRRGPPRPSFDDRPPFGNMNRPFDGPSFGNMNRPFDQPPFGHMNRPPFDGPPFGNVNRPPFGGPQFGQMNRPPFDGPQYGPMGRSPYPPPPHSRDGERLYRDGPDYPSRPEAYPPRDVAPAAPHFDPDPVRRLDALRKARAQQEAQQKDTYLDPDPLKRVRSSKQVLDPDPLRRLMKRDILAKAEVIDYSHGTRSTSRERSSHETKRSKSRDTTWEEDIESILDGRNTDSLSMLSKRYSSSKRTPERKPKKIASPSRPLPFSKSYFDLPENKKKLRDLKVKARSPPIPGMERIPKEPAFSGPIAISSSSSSRSPSPAKGGHKRSKSPASLRNKLLQQRNPLHKAGPYKVGQIPRNRSPSPRRTRSRSPKRYRSPSPKRYRSPSPKRYRSPSPQRSRSPNPYKNLPGYKQRISPRSPDRHKMSYSPVKRRSPFDDRLKEKPPLKYEKPLMHEMRRKMSPIDQRRRKISPIDERTKARLPFMNPSGSRGRDSPPPVKMRRHNSPPTYRSKHPDSSHAAMASQNLPQEPPPEDDNEDAQAERIADMLLKMSSTINTKGDTQATLEALLSNPEVAKTILEAQSKLDKKSPPREERGSTSSSSSRHKTGGQHRVREVRKPEPPSREKVAFSLSGSRGSVRVNQSAAFNESSDEET